MKYVSSSHCELSTAHLQFVFIIIGAFLIVDTTTISIDYATKQHQSLQEVGQVESMTILDNSHQLQKRNNMRLCGMKLVQFISKICNDCVMIPEYSETVILLDKKCKSNDAENLELLKI
jgi:hypothetical protein